LPLAARHAARFKPPHMLEHFVRFLEMLQAWFIQNPSLSVLAFAGVFVLMQLFMIPVAPMGMAAGFFFGFGKGWLALMLGCAFGASVNFFISSHFARAYVHRKLGHHKSVRLIDTAIAREGWKIVALLRFVPIPFGLANYCYGLTPIRWLPYLFATCLAISPANSLFVWMGSTFQGELAMLLGKGRPHHWLEYVIFGVGITAAVLALRYVARVAKNAVEKNGDGQGLHPATKP
jgi:uncharacterized membrane protein YdjX (TVP38/TMEM64 family)